MRANLNKPTNIKMETMSDRELLEIKIAFASLQDAIDKNSCSLWEDTLECTSECIVTEQTTLKFNGDGDEVTEREFTGIFDELNALGELLNRPNAQDLAKKYLNEKGYFTDSLWQIDDIKHKFECTDEQAWNVLNMAFANDATYEQLWMSIEYAGDYYKLKPKSDEKTTN